jgi:hypothetical protein
LLLASQSTRFFSVFLFFGFLCLWFACSCLAISSRFGFQKKFLFFCFLFSLILIAANVSLMCC